MNYKSILPDLQEVQEYHRAINALEHNHKELEKTLRENGEKFKAIADNTHDWENWHAPDGRLLWVNPSVERMTGYSVIECMEIDQFPLPLIHSKDILRMSNYYYKALANPSSENDVPFRVIRKNGSILWVSASWQPLVSREGECMGLRSSMRDISKRKQAENTLRDVIEELRMSNEKVNKNIFELSEMSFKYQTEKIKYENLRSRVDKFISGFSREIVNILMAHREISELDYDKRNKEVMALSEKLERDLRSALKKINQFGSEDNY